MNTTTCLCADSRDVFYEVVGQYDANKLVVVSDPPFNISYKYRSYKDNLGENDYYEMLGFFFGKIPSVVVHYPENLYKLASRIGKIPERVVSWVYNSNTPRQHRDIAFFGIKPDMKKVHQPYKNPKDKRIQKLLASGKKGSKLYDWWNVNQVKNVSKRKTIHPCQMPLEVMKNIIGVLPEDSVIVDPFMGSGTTGVAVKIMNEEQNASRIFVGIEIDEVYYATASKRIWDYKEEYE